MVYEWDAKRARRAHLAKMGFSLIAIMIVLGIPAWVAVAMVG